MYVDHFGDAAEMGDRADGIGAGSVAALFASHDGITGREIDPDIFVGIGQGITRKDPAVPAQLSGFQAVLCINPRQFFEFPICELGAAGRFWCGFWGRCASGSEAGQHGQNGQHGQDVTGVQRPTVTSWRFHRITVID